MSSRRSGPAWAVAAGALAAGVAFVVGLQLIGVLALPASDTDWQGMPIAAALAAGLLGALCWRLLVGAATTRLLQRGAIAGALTGALAHPLTWYLLILYFYATGAQSSLGEPTLNPIEGVPGSLVLSLGSLLVVGWLTVPLGALCGALLAYVRLRRSSGS